MLLQHGCHLEALGEGQKFVDGTEILKEIIAFFLRLQAEDSLKEMVNSIGFEFFIHSASIPHLKDMRFHTLKLYNPYV